MSDLAEKIPVRRLLLIAVGGLATYLLIPMVLTRHNDVKSLREARLARAVKFGDRNAEFTNRIHSQSTLLRMFAQHNDRMNVSGAELKEERKQLYENYRKLYLEIDATEWWWPWEFEREVRALRLLSPAEQAQLHKYITDYSESAKKSIYEPIHLWRFLDSPAYKVRGKESQEKIKQLEDNIDKNFFPEHETRAELVEKITALFEGSDHRTAWQNVVGVSW